MQVQHRVLLAAAGLLIGGVVYARANFSDATTSRSVPKIVAVTQNTDPSKVDSIQKINRQKPTTGNFWIEGFVAKIYSAPECPPGAECKPAMKDNIVVSQDKKTLEAYDLSDREMLVFTDKIAAFQKGAKYRLRIKITDQKTTSREINDVELLSFTRLN